MELGIDTEKETLQSLVKSCLLELNKLKLDLTELEIEKDKNNSNEKIQELENHIIEKEKEVSLIKYRADDEIKVLKSKLDEKDKIIQEQDNKIYELNYVNNSLDKIKESFAEQLREYKKEQLAQVSNQLNDAYKGLAEKDAYINSLSRQIDEYKMNIMRLETNMANRDSLLSLEHELDSKKEELFRKDNELAILKEKTISKEEYLHLKDLISKKDEEIKRLEAVNQLFNDIKEEQEAFNTKDYVPPFKLDKK